MVFEKIKEILAEQLDADAEEMTMDTKIAEDLDADSLDVVGMVVRDKDAKHLSERKSVRAEMLLERAKRQSQINDEPLPLVPKIVTIATTPTAETIQFYIGLIHG